ncbi:MAG: ergothioneine biosynthesis protein EgtB [Pseudomonadota bacterium]
MAADRSAASGGGLQADALIERFKTIRARTEQLCALLSAEDAVVQSMPDASPAKWHMAHTTWFFEQFVLGTHAPSYQPFDAQFSHLFNSYYHTAGSMHARPERGLLTRPTLANVKDYRQHVNAAMLNVLDERLNDLQAEAIRGRGRMSTAHTDAAAPADTLADVVQLGLHHEQQHQELMLTDIKHLLSCNPLHPALRDDLAVSANSHAGDASFHEVSGGIIEIGAAPQTGVFCFDNETPRHQILLHDHKIAKRPVTNGEFAEFIKDGGYDDSTLWLSDGWLAAQRHGWRAPLYWSTDLNSEFTLGGERDIDHDAPVAHVSYYEADAFARWAGARLPTEAEFEYHATDAEVRGNFAESDHWQPMAAGDNDRQWFGDVWEWTSSAYSAYPGFTPLGGSLGEYNGKFMCNKMVVRGGSCLSAQSHLRASYRSFFYPDARWQCLGLRLAQDA